MIKGNLYLPGRARVPIPKKSVEEADKLSGKLMLAVDFKTGEIKWDKEMENKLKPKTKLDLNKDDFLKAIANNRTQAEAIKELGISVGSFYKYKKMWVEDVDKVMELKEMEKARETKFAEILDSVDERKTMLASKEPEGIHTPTPAEVETFFGESETFNPEEPKNKEGKRMNVLDAIELMDEAREESYCVTTIFDQRICFTPEVRKLLETHRNESEMVVDNIENKLGQLIIRL